MMNGSGIDIDLYILAWLCNAAFYSVYIYIGMLSNVLAVVSYRFSMCATTLH